MWDEVYIDGEVSKKDGGLMMPLNAQGLDIIWHTKNCFQKHSCPEIRLLLSNFHTIRIMDFLL